MRQSSELQSPLAIALGGACLLGLGLSGCGRGAIDVAKEEAKTNSAITERANDSILRSRQELAGNDKTTKPAVTNGLALEPDVDEKPALASRWKSPLKSAGNLLRRKPAESVDDPFLAQADEAKSGMSKPAEETTVAGKAAEKKPLAEKKIAQADATLKPGRDAASPDSKAALDDFLKSQKPVDINDRAAMASYESEVLTRKPGSNSPAVNPAKKTASETFASSSAPSRSRSLDSADDGHGLSGSSITPSKTGPARPFSPDSRVALDDLLKSKSHSSIASSVVATKPGVARPFPADFESHDSHSTSSTPNSAVGHKVAATEQATKNPLASGAGRLRTNPLTEETPATAEEQESGPEIAALIEKSKAAGDQGKFRQALEFAVAAKELAQQCNYEFAAGEQSPDELVDWISERVTEAQQLAQDPAPRQDRRQIVATRTKPVVDAKAAAYSTPKAEDIFGVHQEEPAAEESLVAVTPTKRKQPAARSAFNEWAAGVGARPVAKERSPEWPVLSNSELMQSDEMWQPSRAGFEHVWSATPAQPLRKSGEATTHLASAEVDAAAFVATADAQSLQRTASRAPATSPLVELGRPTDVAPYTPDNLLARNDVAMPNRHRGPRLSAPPPLSIEDGGDTVSRKSIRSSTKTRMLWFGSLGLLLVGSLVGFRRWAYRVKSEVVKS